jgi:hypothetical protein
MMSFSSAWDSLTAGVSNGFPNLFWLAFGLHLDYLSLSLVVAGILLFKPFICDKSKYHLTSRKGPLIQTRLLLG